MTLSHQDEERNRLEDNRNRLLMCISKQLEELTTAVHRVADSLESKEKGPEENDE